MISTGITISNLTNDEVEDMNILGRYYQFTGEAITVDSDNSHPLVAFLNAIQKKNFDDAITNQLTNEFNQNILSRGSSFSG